MTLSRAELLGWLLLFLLPHYMWFGEKASHSWFWFSCLSKEAGYPCTFIDAVDSQLSDLPQISRAYLDCAESSPVNRGGEMVESFQLFSLAILCQNLFYLMQKTFKYKAVMKTSTLQSLFCFLITHSVVLASHLCRESWGQGGWEETHSSFPSHSTRKKKSQKSAPFPAYTTPVTDF